jgi:CRISPR/Cas system-associated exonuclease Cas4 (RecB family)
MSAKPQPRRTRRLGEARVISASEIGEFEYCERAWWYRHVVKLSPPRAGEVAGRFARGREAHRRHGMGVARAAWLRSVGVALALAGSLIIMATILAIIL